MHGMALLLGMMRENSAEQTQSCLTQHIKDILNALMNRPFNRKLYLPETPRIVQRRPVIAIVAARQHGCKWSASDLMSNLEDCCDSALPSVP